MKLMQIIRKYLLIGMFIVMIIGCVSHFFIFRFFLHNYTDNILYEHKELIVNYIEANGDITTYPTSMVKPSRIEEHSIDDPDLHPETIKDTLLYSELTGNFRSYRQLYFPIYYKNKWHQICINQPTIKENNLLPIIFSSLLLLFILLILFTYLISYYLKKRIWIPFYYNLQKLYGYDLKANTVLSLTDHNIKEFDELNEVIMRMVRKINEDYENSRIFIEDASHEMQTPLSIIKSKLDILLQSNFLQDKEQAKNIAAMSRAVSRLSRLNRSLLLLNKINNDQFQNKELVNITSLIENYLEDLKELIEAKQIHLQCSLEEVTCNISVFLSEVLISNLLSNSIRHNVKGGKLKIELTSQYLVIKNDCIQPVNSENLFTRLVYMRQSEESSGLGLNIIKSICDKNNFEISYEYPNPTAFRIKMTFPST